MYRPPGNRNADATVCTVHTARWRECGYSAAVTVGIFSAVLIGGSTDARAVCASASDGHAQLQNLRCRWLIRRAAARSLWSANRRARCGTTLQQRTHSGIRGRRRLSDLCAAAQQPRRVGRPAELRRLRTTLGTYGRPSTPQSIPQTSISSATVPAEDDAGGKRSRRQRQHTHNYNPHTGIFMENVAEKWKK